jgi:hypothetical protein
VGNGFWIGFWIFASVALVLIVLHPGFRRFAKWAGIVAGALAVVGVGAWILVERAKNSRVETAAEFDPAFHPFCPDPPAAPTPGCVSQSSEPWKQYQHVDDPDRVVAIGGCPFDARGKPRCPKPGAPMPADDLAADAWKEIVDACPVGSYVMTDGKGQIRCTAEMLLSPGSKLYCPEGTVDAVSARSTGSCYNPKDRAQLRAHVEACEPQKVVPAHPRGDGHELTSMRAVADKRGAPCSVDDQLGFIPDK